jgi:hypothetical protein
MRPIFSVLLFLIPLLGFSQYFYDGSGRKVARFDKNLIFNASGHQIGRIDADRVFDGSGHQVGRVDGNNFYDGSGHQIGRVDGNNLYNSSGSRLAGWTGIICMMVLVIRLVGGAGLEGCRLSYSFITFTKYPIKPTMFPSISYSITAPKSS